MDTPVRANVLATLKLLFGLVWIFGCLYLARGFNAWLPTGLPDSILGMLLLFVLLWSRLLPIRWVEPGATPLLKWMGLLFVPAGAGVIDHFPLLANDGLTIVLTAGVSTFLIMTSVGWLYQWWEHKRS